MPITLPGQGHFPESPTNFDRNNYNLGNTGNYCRVCKLTNFAYNKAHLQRWRHFQSLHHRIPEEDRVIGTQLPPRRINHQPRANRFATVPEEGLYWRRHRALHQHYNTDH